MKPEEALKELSYGDTAYGGNCTYEVRMGAIKALKKQIPMKPNNIKLFLTFLANTIRQKAIVQFAIERNLINQIFIVTSVVRN